MTDDLLANEISNEVAIKAVVDAMSILMSRLNPAEITTLLFKTEAKDGQKIFFHFIGGMHLFFLESMKGTPTVEDESPSRYDN